MIYQCDINPFGADILHKEKPGDGISPTETADSSKRVTF